MVGADRLASASEALSAALAGSGESRAALVTALSAINDTLPRLEAWLAARGAAPRETAA
jgi:hypothetical protein